MKMLFGKYKGYELKDIPDNYRRWLIEANICKGALGRRLIEIGYDMEKALEQQNQWKQSNQEIHDEIEEAIKNERMFTKCKQTTITGFIESPSLTKMFDDIYEKHHGHMTDDYELSGMEEHWDKNYF
jgi:uncharacterized protein (DUF3820 family)